MKIFEVADTNIPKLMALAQFLDKRAKDELASEKVSVATFLKMAQRMEIPLTADRLKDLIQTPPLNGVISNVTGDEVIFHRAGEDSEAAMSPEQSEKTVDQMAKSATDIK